MLSLHAAANLLTAAATIEHLVPLARAAGCAGTPLPLVGETRSALGITDTTDARIATGAGALRALLLEWPRGVSLRERIAAAAPRLSARAPHLLWLVIAVERAGTALTLATWTADCARPRIAALTVDRRRIVPSDAETLCALAAATDGDDVMTQTRWVEILGRDALTRRFYRALDGVVSDLATGAVTRASADDRRAIALLWLSRLLFLSFLETKGWLDGDRRFLARHFETCAGGGGAHRRLLLPLFFGTLNTPMPRRAAAARAFGRIPFLNGGLFGRSAVERQHATLHFPDDALGRVFDDLLSRYRFTAREDDVDWSDAAVDPEMLGKAFESLMASRDRRVSGTFYTPHALVSRVTGAGLVEALAGRGLRESAVADVLDGSPVDSTAASLLRQRILDLAIIDPACGSGAFLVHALETLTRLLVRCHDSRDPVTIRRALLTRCIFGVDINPTAVWLCELRLWLAVVIEHDETDPRRIPPLPNLDRHIRVGDALHGDAFREGTIAPGGARIARLRSRYARASGSRKRTLERELERAERAHARSVLEGGIARCAAARRALLAAWRGCDLFGERYSPSTAERDEAHALRLRSRELRGLLRTLSHGGALPFSFPTHFPDAAARGGFDAIIGNPPWVRLHRIPLDARRRLRATFTVLSRGPWEHGAEAAHAGRGFAGQVDLAALFVERSLDLLREGAPLALLLPAKLWRALAGGGVRRVLAERATVVALEDWSESPGTFDAATYPSLLVAVRGRRAPLPDVAMALRCRAGIVRWSVKRSALGIDDDTAAPWMVLPPPAREAFDRLRGRGVPLHQSGLGRPLLGVKCGCNEAFIVSTTETAVERSMLRPVMRGGSLERWGMTASGEAIIWTHGADGRVLPALPPNARRWLERWRRRLTARADAHGSCWWALFRTAAADCRRARVVWPDIAKSPRAVVLAPGDPVVPLNSCYVVACDREEDAHAFAALLNSPVAGAWLNAIAEPARGGYHRYLGWTVALLPVPQDWERARTLLAPLGMRAAAGRAVDDDELLRATARAYRLRPADLEPLLAWTGR